ncbi:MAG: hypothetical protein ABI360_05330 [Allobranchiibius sp.]
MLWLVVALVICLALSAVVVGLVAVPARREGRQVLTERGERMLSSVTDRKSAKQDDSAHSAG